MEALKKVFGFLFDKWWIYTALYGIGAWLVIFLTIVSIALPQVGTARLYIIVPLLVIVALSLVWQLANRRWAVSAIHAGMVAFSGIYLFAFTANVSDLQKINPPTNYTPMPTVHEPTLEIPEDIELHEPVLTDNGTVDSSIYAEVRTKPDLTIYQDFEPGLYKYDYFAGKTEAGTLYLKAYEVTQNNPLSADDMERQTKAYAYNWSKKIVPITSGSSFTIHEGNNGEAYAARFEVWLKPHNGGEERMLMEKIYRIRGWADL